MKKAFTMIELIFVIVIIGILASVAIPKLAATRDDAQVSKIIAHARTALSDMGAYYTSQGAGGWENNASLFTVTNVPFTHTENCTPIDSSDQNTTKISPNVFTLCDNNANPCVTFTTTTGGNLNISSDATGQICQAVSEHVIIIRMAKSYKLGGSVVRR
jgi:prepilin-type N-terminal cleavage/methylation domain-containing protein